MKMSDEKLGMIGLAAIVAVVVLLIGGCSAGCDGDRDNPAYDKDGFLGDSDDFWELQSKQ